MRGVVVDTVFDGRPITVHAPLRGAFQVANIATAVAVCDALRATRQSPSMPALSFADARRCAGGVGWTGSTANRRS